jgi:sec-independent protein translocase protein TatA
MNTVMAMGIGSPTDMAIIAVVVVLLFGGAKVAGFGKAIGQSVRGFKEEVNATDTKPSATAPDEPSTK